MRAFIAILCIFALGGMKPALAGERQLLGYGRIVNNDYLGDGYDRGHTGDVSSSRIKGIAWNGVLPEKVGDIIEYRISAGIIAPANLNTPLATDRPYAGYLSFGMHTHFQRQGLEFAFGADLVATGPQTGLGDFQTLLHDSLGGVTPSTGVLDNQIGNGFHPTLVAEVGRDMLFSPSLALRPFLETRLGLEDLVRVGLDLTIGQVGRGGLLIRDSVTGQRYRTIRNDHQGLSFVMGGDVARVSNSALLPASRGYVLTEARHRLRAGVHWQGARSDAFYGVSWLGHEYLGQANSQLVGSVRLNLKF